ncbi:right-handed parallel beta-helix repeat-containing protein [Teichococcus oryzae]|uniref:right-handed parallel beta-helix repeat-containing protein n=1 Tax=Teichococcus oryzae TaxID=1608942 RepID=UPI0013762F76|nr:right-handed parallel beta-helix repeat-containing protein [Pseudoroseomonas oryzae]
MQIELPGIWDAAASLWRCAYEPDLRGSWAVRLKSLSPQRQTAWQVFDVAAAPQTGIAPEAAIWLSQADQALATGNGGLVSALRIAELPRSPALDRDTLLPVVGRTSPDDGAPFDTLSTTLGDIQDRASEAAADHVLPQARDAAREEARPIAREAGADAAREAIEQPLTEVAEAVRTAAGSAEAADRRAGDAEAARDEAGRLAGDAEGSVIERTTYRPTEAPDAPTRPVINKLRERISVSDFATLRDGENWRPAFMAAIDETPDGWEILVPANDVSYWVDWIDLCGSLQDKLSGTRLRGQGMKRSVIRKFAHNDIPTALGRRKSVVEALFGHGHALFDLAVIGNGDTAPVIPYTTNWTPGQIFTYSSTSERIVSTAPDGTFAAVRTAADRVFVLVASHTADAVSILPDLAAGHWREVTGQTYDEMTQTGYFNSYTLDADYENRHAIYMNGSLEPMRDTVISGVLVSQSWYGGIVQGSGPLFADNKGFGTLNAISVDCRAEDCRASSWGGGHAIGRRIINPTGIRPGSSCIKLDEGSHRALISGARFTARDAQTDPRGASPEGIQAYKSDDAVIVGCELDGFTIGFLSNSSDRLRLDDNIVRNGSSGFRIIGGEGHSLGVGNKAIGVKGRGFVLSDLLFPQVIAGEAISCAGVGAELTALRYGRVALTARGCGTLADDDGIRATGCRHVVFDAVRGYDNGKTDSNVSAGLRMVDCYDCDVVSPAAANLTTTAQSYGVVEEGAASARNRFRNLNVGANRVANTVFTAAATVENATTSVQGFTVPGDYTATVGNRFDVAGKALRLPRRNTANRPASPQGGDTGFNTDNSRVEVYASGAWAFLLTTAGNVTMTAPFTLSGDATAALHPVTKQQLDAVGTAAASAASAAASAQTKADAALPLAGGVSMTGLFSLSGPGTAGNQPVTKTQLDGVNTTATTANNTASGALQRVGGIVTGAVEVQTGGTTSRRAILPVVAGGSTTNAEPTQLGPIGAGTGPVYTLPNNSAVMFRATIVARTSSGASAAWTARGLIKRGADASATTLVGASVTAEFSDAAFASATVTALADTTGGGLAIQVTGLAGGVFWTCSLEGARQS